MTNITRIVLNEDKDALVPGNPYPFPGVRRPYGHNSQLIVANANGLIGKHEHCGGDLRYIQTWTYGGVIACQGGCNLRIKVPWKMRDYQALLGHMSLFNNPTAPYDPTKDRHDA